MLLYFINFTSLSPQGKSLNTVCVITSKFKISSMHMSLNYAPKYCPPCYCYILRTEAVPYLRASGGSLQPDKSNSSRP